jgi:hypothetical protein
MDVPYAELGLARCAEPKHRRARLLIFGRCQCRPLLLLKKNVRWRIFNGSLSKFK